MANDHVNKGFYDNVSNAIHVKKIVLVKSWNMKQERNHLCVMNYNLILFQYLGSM